MLWRPSLVISASALVGILTIGVRSYLHRRRIGDSRGDSGIYSAMILLAKVAQCVGILKFFIDRLGARRTALIEYKSAPVANAR